MYQLIEKVVRNWQNFAVFQSPLDLSIIYIFRTEAFGEISLGAPSISPYRSFQPILYSVYLTFTGYYIDDNAQTDTRS